MSSRVFSAETTDFRDQPNLSMLPNCVILETPAATLWGDPRVSEPARKSIAKDPQRFIRFATAMPVKISRETLVLETELPLDGETCPVAVKYYCPPSFAKKVSAMFRRPKAVRSWEKAEFLRTQDIATPGPLLACLLRGWASLGGNFLVTQWVTGGENLHLFGWRLAKRPLDERLRFAAACAESLGRMIGRLHAAGATHRDLKAANLLVVETDSGLKTWLVDLDGLRIGGTVSFDRQARDIARLAAGMTAHPWVTGSVACRFLRAYAREFPQGTIAWKPLWRAVVAYADQITRRKRKRGEQVL
jgi:tRNA A-37 threonylcarbamoyl transferase component Bud32